MKYFCFLLIGSVKGHTEQLMPPLVAAIFLALNGTLSVYVGAGGDFDLESPLVKRHILRIFFASFLAQS